VRDDPGKQEQRRCAWISEQESSPAEAGGSPFLTLRSTHLGVDYDLGGLDVELGDRAPCSDPV